MHVTMQSCFFVLLPPKIHVIHLPDFIRAKTKNMFGLPCARGTDPDPQAVTYSTSPFSDPDVDLLSVTTMRTLFLNVNEHHQTHCPLHTHT
jgi:hypothetical protein